MTPRLFILFVLLLAACRKTPDPVETPAVQTTDGRDGSEAPVVEAPRDPLDDARLEASLKRLDEMRAAEALDAGHDPEPPPAPLDVPRALDGTDALRAEAGEAAVVAQAQALAKLVRRDGPAAHEAELQTFIDLPRNRERVQLAVGHLLVIAARESLLRMDITKAGQYARLAREIHEADSGAYMVLGEIEFQQSNYEQAFQLYETGLLRNPNDRELKNIYAKRKLEAPVAALDRKSSAHFVVSFEGGSDSDAAQLTLESLEQAYNDVGEMFDLFPEDKTSVVLYPNRSFDIMHRHPAWAAGSYDGKLRLGVAGAAGQTRNFRATLYHEYAHALFHRSTGNATCPAWLNEGLAEVAAERAGGETTLTCAAGHTLPLRNLERSFSLLDARQARVAYLEARHATDRLIAKHSIEKVRECLKLAKKSHDFEGAFDEAMGESVTSFASSFDAEATAPQ